MSENKLGIEELLERIDEVLNVLKMVSRDLADISRELRSTATPEGPPPPAAEIGTIEDVRALFPKDLEEMLTFEESGDYIVVRPRQYLGSENFAKIAAVVRDAGGEYISAGKESHFRIPRER
ncbi:hypothetical protein GWN63_04395 [Candidatus Bathyarchaeota archaeon]|nr:hypothetical protein [Candidatus Bathyarchaeota archaeon]NIU81467.1 hypothetical protein [Candidatus Bathyarchaeota archaeon]NIV68113.1 hypothetical protein [Candidatus Bathyarchaeota archaeon]NIW16023.1 hypothetical protein [Candidatus Bathyarchaeota archaeon]NIW34624.1 hypothetical protein [Candidatus Bathyarchaeota archaeon]